MLVSDKGMEPVKLLLFRRLSLHKQNKQTNENLEQLYKTTITRVTKTVSVRKGRIHTETVILSAFQEYPEQLLKNCLNKDPSSLDSSNSQGHQELVRLCYYCTIPCQIRGVNLSWNQQTKTLIGTRLLAFLRDHAYTQQSTLNKKIVQVRYRI